LFIHKERGESNMSAVGKIQEWGNSQGVRIPKNILADADIKKNDEVEILTYGRNIVIKKRGAARPNRRTIYDLFKDFKGPYLTEEINWGEPKGKEVW